MDTDQIETVQVFAGGSILEAVIGLWQLTAGGRLDYALDVPMHGCPEAVSLCELFYLGSDGYRDLKGSIEYERDSRRRALRKTVFPERAVVRAADRRLRVLRPHRRRDRRAGCRSWPCARMEAGLARSWTDAIREHSVWTVATGLHVAFGTLRLDGDN